MRIPVYNMAPPSYFFTFELHKGHIRLTYFYLDIHHAGLN